MECRCLTLDDVVEVLHFVFVESFKPVPYFFGGLLDGIVNVTFFTLPLRGVAEVHLFALLVELCKCFYCCVEVCAVVGFCELLCDVASDCNLVCAVVANEVVNGKHDFVILSFVNLSGAILRGVPFDYIAKILLYFQIDTRMCLFFALCAPFLTIYGAKL
nr:MAG TPA: hypothetical protein [Caudoviricetes sp.]